MTFILAIASQTSVKLLLFGIRKRVNLFTMPSSGRVGALRINAVLRDAAHEDTIAARTGPLIDPYFFSKKFKWILANVDGAGGRATQGGLVTVLFRPNALILSGFTPKYQWAFPFQCRMSAAQIVKPINVLEYFRVYLASGLPRLPPDQFGFQGLKEGL